MNTQQPTNQPEKKPQKRKTTQKQAKAIKILVEKGGSVSGAMRKAGYSPKTAKNPDKLTGTKAYKDILNAAGLTDDFLAKGHKELATAADLREMRFPYIPKTVMVELDPDDPKWDKGGRDHQFNEETDYVPMTKKDIEKVIKGMTGCKLIHTVEGYRETIAYYTIPNHLARRSAYEMGYKVKGHFLADKSQNPLGQEPTPAEVAAVTAALAAVKHGK